MLVGSKFDYWATVLVDGTFPTHDYCLLSRQNVVCSRLLRTSIFASSFGAQLKRRRRLIGARPLALERFVISCGLLILDLFLIWNETQFNLQDRTKFFFVFASATSEWRFLLCLIYLSLNEKNCRYALQCCIETAFRGGPTCFELRPGKRLFWVRMFIASSLVFWSEILRYVTNKHIFPLPLTDLTECLMSHDLTRPLIQSNTIVCQEMQGEESRNRPLVLNVSKLFL